MFTRFVFEIAFYKLNSTCELVFQLEIDAGSELTEEFLHDELHPKRNIYRPKFEKPKGPPNRGAKRLTKSQQ